MSPVPGGVTLTAFLFLLCVGELDATIALTVEADVKEQNHTRKLRVDFSRNGKGDGCKREWEVSESFRQKYSWLQETGKRCS